MYYKSQKNRILHDKTLELSAIADLKVRQIAKWRNERGDDARLIGENTPFVRLCHEYLYSTEKIITRAEVVANLKSLIQNSEYKNILLIDSTAKVGAYYPNQDTVLGDHMLQMFPEFIKLRTGILTDLHKTSRVSYNHLDLVIPLLNHWDENPVQFGLIIIRVDPQVYLYPLIQTWPVPGKTAESLLIRQEGDHVLYLNELKFKRSSELEFTKSIHEENLPGAMALRGIESTTNGIDYRGTPVVAVMKKVPGSPWYMIAKTDHHEVFMALNRQITMITVIIILFILAIGLVLGLIEWNENARFYREKYEAELEHQALRKHYDNILKYANDIIFLVDKNMIIVEANDRATETYQRDRNELIGLSLRDIKAPGAVKNIEEERRILDEKGYATYESEHVRKDGTVLPVEISAKKVEIEGVKYYQSICRDITERKIAEQVLKESEERFRKIFEESPLSIVMTGKDLGIIRVNAEFTRMTGYSEDELRTKQLRDIIHPDYMSNDDISFLRLVAEEIPVYHTENKYVRKDGNVIWGSTTISVIRNNRDEVQYFLTMIEDITFRKNSEAELIAAKEKAEESDRLKTAFLHNISHEIRTPMNAIIGFSALLNEPDTTEEERKQYIDIIFQSGSHLLSIINDIVDIANIESGQAKVNIREINLNSSMRSLLEQFSYKEKPDLLTINLSTGLPDEKAVIMTDSTKLIQVLSNLINNATKFTREGTIDFGYTVNDSFLEFYVKDTGIGIPPEFHEKIFDRFFQVDNLISRKFGGTGLGLSISKANIELLGGKIWLNSKPGEGTEFRFTIPNEQSGKPRDLK